MDNNEKSTLPKTPDEVRAFLVQQRIKINLTQRNIADAIGCGTSLISNIENGTNSISRKRLPGFASAYKISEDTLKLLVLSGKSGRRIGSNKKIAVSDEHTDILPLIKVLATSDRKNLLVSEMHTLIDGFVKIQTGMQGLSTEMQEMLFKTLHAPATKSAE